MSRPTPRWRALRSRARSTTPPLSISVVEAVPERLELKVRVFRDLDRAAPAGTILASNTSGFAIAGLAAATDRADRVLGWHWASPAPVMRLAEIVSTRDTSDETVAAGQGRGGRVREEPRRRPRHADGVGVRDQPRLLRHGRRGAEGRERGHRDCGRRGPADDGLLPLAHRPLRHGAGQRSSGRWDRSRSRQRKARIPTVSLPRYAGPPRPTSVVGGTRASTLYLWYLCCSPAPRRSSATPGS